MQAFVVHHALIIGWIPMINGVKVIEYHHHLVLISSW